MNDERFKNILTKDIVQDIPVIYIVKVYVALKEVEYESNIKRTEQE